MIMIFIGIIMFFINIVLVVVVVNLILIPIFTDTLVCISGMDTLSL
jgi:hypothetical protein